MPLRLASKKKKSPRVRTTAAKSAAHAAPISVNAHQPAYKVNKAKIKAIAAAICSQLGTGGQMLAITFVDEAEIRRLNFEFRGYDKTTDVLSFPQQEFAKPLVVAKSKTKAKSAPQTKKKGTARNFGRRRDLFGERGKKCARHRPRFGPRNLLSFSPRDLTFVRPRPP